LLVVFLSSKER